MNERNLFFRSQEDFLNLSDIKSLSGGVVKKNQGHAKKINDSFTEFNEIF
jgi:hypothetical protein